MGDIIGGVLGGIASIFGAKEEKEAIESSTDAATSAQLQALDMQWKMYQQQREDFKYLRDLGQWGAGRLRKLIKEGPGEFIPEEQPGYQFGFKNFIEDPYLASTSARGRRLSGPTTKALTKYAGDYAETSYDNFLARYYQKLSPYQSAVGLGMTGLQGSANAAQQYASGASNALSNIGQIQSQGALAQGSANTGLIAALAGVGQGMAQNYLNMQYLNRTLGTPTPSGFPSNAGVWGPQFDYPNI